MCYLGGLKYVLYFVSGHGGEQSLDIIDFSARWAFFFFNFLSLCPISALVRVTSLCKTLLCRVQACLTIINLLDS